MRLSAALSVSQLLAIVSGASAMFELETSRKFSGTSRGLRKLLGKARRLEDGGNDDGANDGNGAEEYDVDEMEAFLMDFSMKLMKCIPDQVITDADDVDHYGAVVFRLCPSKKCSDDYGCKSGYADFAVDIGTYVESFMYDQADNMSWDDKFDGISGECTQWNGGSYYTGATCTSDGKGIKMGLFEDAYCSAESSTSFEDISNGWTLPYSSNSGGLVTTECTSCVDDDGSLRQMCSDMYENSPYRCEADFGFKHYYYDNNFEMYKYGQDTTGCSKIDVMVKPRMSFSSEAVWTDAILVLMLVAATGAGYLYYQQWWEKRKYFCFFC